MLTLAPGAKRLDIDTEVDWHETEKFLKAAFPLDIHAERYASETQFGHFYRATHTNTSWEAAKFEACNHRFVHLEEPGWGVALVNDSTYGHDVTRTVRDSTAGTTTTVRVSLLRAPRFPDPETDQECTASATRSRRAPRSATRSVRASGSTCRSAGSPATVRWLRW